MRDAGQVKHRILVRHGVEPGVVAERTFAAQFAQFHIAFENNLRMGGHFQVDRLALHDLHRLAAQETRRS